MCEDSPQESAAEMRERQILFLAERCAILKANKVQFGFGLILLLRFRDSKWSGDEAQAELRWGKLSSDQLSLSQRRGG